MSEDEPGSSDELDDYHRVRRRRAFVIVLLVSLVSLVMAVLVAALVWWRLTRLPSLDRETEQNVREALGEIEKLPIDVRRSFAAQAIAELETDRLPSALVDAFGDYVEVPPEYAGIVLLEPFAHDVDARASWDLACPVGLAAIADGAAEGPRVTYVRCELARFNLVKADELVDVSVPELVACHAAWAWLVEHDADSELERRVFRLLMLGR